MIHGLMRLLNNKMPQGADAFRLQGEEVWRHQERRGWAQRLSEPSGSVVTSDPVVTHEGSKQREPWERTLCEIAQTRRFH